MEMDNQTDVDGNPESELLEFLYKPSDIPFGRQVSNTEMFFTRLNEQAEFTSEISNTTRSNLIRRQEELNSAFTNNINLEYISNQLNIDLNECISLADMNYI